MPGCVIILPGTVPPKTVSPKTVSERLDLSFGIFARRGEKYSCYRAYTLNITANLLIQSMRFGKLLYKYCVFLSPAARRLMLFLCVR
ncbi:hypothetical protein NM96_09440 [Neisseria mucosa]|nr:hypothetical protein NM96_09440 [Neisseria mucosa]